jgi:hypothetical protein
LNLSLSRTAFAALLLGLPATALAQNAEDPPICTDRPTKANAVCTVPAGNWQLESSVVSWAGTEAGGDETNVWNLGATVLKLGLSDRSDLQIGFTPLVRVETKHGGAKSKASGFGDVTVRYKHRLTQDGTPVQVAAIPFIKLPTADGDIGNGKVEGGLAIPISISTGSPVTVLLGPELDLLADSDGGGMHVQLVNLINVSGPIAPRLTLIGELWMATSFDPADTVTQMSADAALAYAASQNLQLDTGVNVGLSNAADIEIYAGLSLRF